MRNTFFMIWVLAASSVFAGEAAQQVKIQCKDFQVAATGVDRAVELCQTNLGETGIVDRRVYEVCDSQFRKRSEEEMWQCVATGKDKVYSFDQVETCRTGLLSRPKSTWLAFWKDCLSNAGSTAANASSPADDGGLSVKHRKTLAKVLEQIDAGNLSQAKRLIADLLKTK